MIQFDLYGFVSFEDCVFIHHSLVIYLHRTRSELKPMLNLIPKNLTEVFALEGLKLIRTRLDNPLSTTLVIVDNSMRRVYIGDCVLIDHKFTDYNTDPLLEIVVGKNYFPANDSLDVSLASVSIENSTLETCQLKFETFTPLPFSYTIMRNILFKDSALAKFIKMGVFGFEFENCTFTASDFDRPRGIHLRHVSYLFVKDCEISIFAGNKSECLIGCALNAVGAAATVQNSLKFRIISEFKSLPKRTVLIENTKFFGSHAHHAGGAVYVRDMNLIIRNCSMTMRIHSKPPDTGGLIFYDSTFFYTVVKMDNVVLNAHQMKLSRVPLITMFSTSTKINNLNTLCPPSLKVVLKKTKSSLDLSCVKSCSTGYTFQSITMLATIIDSFWSSDPTYVSVNTTNVLCFSCSVGANCTDDIKALPNYWGYINQSDFVTMFRCPDGYCCQDFETCKGIDSCNVGRTATLCGTCIKNYTESLFTSKCIPKAQCHGFLFLFLYVASAVVYGTILILGENVKNKIKITFQNILKCFKNRKSGNGEDQFKHLKSDNSRSPSEPNNEQDKSDSDSSMKYIQILFYYVQDASLFKIHLPEDGQSLTKTIDLCFSYSPSATTKVLFKTMLGPSVMGFILLIYLVQRVFPVEKCQRVKSLKFMMVRAFLLALLFSFQTIVTGAFLLVQCVDVDNSRVLYIQGSIHCYAWWQVIIQVLILTYIIPVVLVFSFSPFCVKNKMMSIRLFMLVFSLSQPWCFIWLPGF